MFIYFYLFIYLKHYLLSILHSINKINKFTSTKKIKIMIKKIYIQCVPKYPDNFDLELQENECTFLVLVFCIVKFDSSHFV